MKKILYTLILVLAVFVARAQPTIYPAKPQGKQIALTGATIHTGNGQVIQNGYVSFENGKITAIGDAATVRFNTNTTDVIDATGKHIYPGFIAPVTNLGLAEIESVRATLDYQELGEFNPHIRAIISYNTDSKVPNTLRTNGILLAQTTPQGGIISGQSSVVELDGWNWQDVAYKTDMAIHLNWPSQQVQSRGGFGGGPTVEQLRERAQKALSNLESYMAQAQGYAQLSKSDIENSRFLAMKGLFDGSKKLFVSTNSSKDIIAAVNFFKKYGITPVIVGGADAHTVTGFLKDNNVAVIINQPHSLPNRTDDDVYLPYKQAKLLQDAGVLFAISVDGYWQQRNLPFMAGTAAAYGLTKEQALASITLNTAKILGIDKTSGSIEVGKDATLFVSAGDALDMLGNKIEKAFIRGKSLDMDNWHQQLFERYKAKYNVEK